MQRDAFAEFRFEFWQHCKMKQSRRKSQRDLSRRRLVDGVLGPRTEQFLHRVAEAPAAMSVGLVTEDEQSIVEVLDILSRKILVAGSSQSVLATDSNNSDGIILGLAVDEGGGIISLHGSAVMVAPGVAVSAWHVCAPYEQTMRNRQTSVTCLGVRNGQVDIWKVAGIVKVPDSDLSVLSLRRTSAASKSFTVHVAHMTTRLPACGEPLALLGWRQGLATERVERRIQLAADLLVGSGKVIEQHPTGRDSVMIPGPALTIEARTVGGMSGGPVFDTNGCLIGVLSSGYDDGPCCISLLWPALIQEFKGGWPEKFMSGLHTLINSDKCVIDRREAFSRLPGTLSYEIEQW